MSNIPIRTLADRLPQMRALAEEAKKAAADAKSPELKRAYEELAESWEQLLREIAEIDLPP